MQCVTLYLFRIKSVFLPVFEKQAVDSFHFNQQCTVYVYIYYFNNVYIITPTRFDTFASSFGEVQLQNSLRTIQMYRNV